MRKNDAEEMERLQSEVERLRGALVLLRRERVNSSRSLED